ncbi:MBL fold metallo-hydrolase [Agrococcus jejuensis]|uniref:MBL fold metallo-hydrolase n=1 Tax=Agrococcus jejuensis TaxID=399736 RepID=UPI0012F9275A|nr:MBL fold metallo-hydrolase [Agrococcus jejuensis]
MSAITSVRITQWGVGHGGFHTQSIDVKGERVHVVYDCGSSDSARRVEDAADEYARSIAGERVERLVLSHFDDDHINGLRYLADAFRKNDVTVGRIVAPLLTPLDRLVLALASEGDRSLRRLILEPEAVLGEEFGAEIQLVAGNDLGPVNNAPLGSDSDSTGRRVRGRVDGGFDVNEDAGTPSLVWEVVPYVYPAISNERGRYWSRLCEKLPDLSDVGVPSNADVSMVLTEHIKVARETRPNSRKSDWTNFSSITLYSGPTGPSTVGWIHAPRGRPIAGAIGWLGTGDSRYGQKRTVDAMSNALGLHRLKNVGVVGAPHHGSAKNSSAHFWSQLPNVMVATFHASGRHGHPTIQAMRQAADSGAAVVPVNDRSYEQCAVTLR